MTILAIETSGKTFSIAVAQNGELAGEVFWNSDFTHSEKLIPAIKWLLNNLNLKIEQVQKIAVSTGPGSFTGIRVGMSCAKVLAQNLDAELVCVDTFDILSKSVNADGCLVIPVIDALRGEAFVKLNNKAALYTIEGLAKKINSISSKVALAGSALVKNKDRLKKLMSNKKKVIFSNVYFPRAGVLALMAGKLKSINYNMAKPLYIRQSWAEENK
ncbi:MAG: tRNA (adenosine(37)-N6)-threonylcarbamoyltransferase complex dimerization subunit type 1 TsaB [Elusimicrobia bacterium]|nr:tRNA (adenosine(37)-N6)-threonylcarbamoyltransferase complex dimerization subunit type 1 TsaB [Candidatus Liberimonas magnetica]